MAAWMCTSHDVVAYRAVFAKGVPYTTAHGIRGPGRPSQLDGPGAVGDFANPPLPPALPSSLNPATPSSLIPAPSYLNLAPPPILSAAPSSLHHAAPTSPPPRRPLPSPEVGSAEGGRHGAAHGLVVGAERLRENVGLLLGGQLRGKGWCEVVVDECVRCASCRHLAMYRCLRLARWPLSPNSGFTPSIPTCTHTSNSTS